MTNRTKQELLPPANDGPTTATGIWHWLTDPLPGRFVLPATGLLVLGLDWLLFPKEVATFGLATPLTAVLGFLAGSIGAFHLQRHYGRDTTAMATLKAVLAGIFVGLPFPLAGTFVGAWVLATSGLAAWKSRLASARLFRK
jgi:hypothetical protein